MKSVGLKQSFIAREILTSSGVQDDNGYKFLEILENDGIKESEMKLPFVKDDKAG